MARTKLRKEMVDAPGGGYYQVDILLHEHRNGYGDCTLPDGIGRVIVKKEVYQYPVHHESFAWKIVTGSKRLVS